VGVKPLDAGDTAEDAFSGMTSGGHKQPRNRIRIWRIDPSHRFACDFTPIVVLPGRAGIVSADDRSLLIVKLCIRSLQGPAVLAVRSRLTRVDLRSRRVNLQDNFLAGGRFNLVGYIGSRNRLSICECNDSGQNGNLEKSCDHGENSNTKGMTSGFAAFFFAPSTAPRILLWPRWSTPQEILRNAPFGRIAFANTDLAGAMDHRYSIPEAQRAVGQLLDQMSAA
jgi:hypothetical protein